MASNEPHSFGAVLRHFRLAAGLTQAALAERAGISERAVTDLERDPARWPRMETASLLAQGLGLGVSERAQLLAAAQRRGARPAVAATPDGAESAMAGHIPFVGRVDERDLLERFLQGAGTPLLIVAGEPGIGKTRLLHEAARRAPDLGWRVLRGGCQRHGGHEPYAPLVDALAHAVRDLAPARRPAALSGCTWLARLLPELAADGLRMASMETSPAWSLPPEQERRLIFASAARFLANITGARGTLLVLDDLQWAGSDALDLLVALARATCAASSPQPRSLGVLGAYRDTDVQPGDPLAVMLADLAHAGLVTHHTLAPLAPHETRVLLDAILSQGVSDPPRRTGVGYAAMAERLVQRAGGVPFFLVSCAQSVARSTGRDLDGAALEPGWDDELPWDVTQSIRQRVAALPEATQSILGTAAVIGRSVPSELLVRVTARPDEDVLDALDAASRARLLEDDGAGRYRFSHDVIREVIEADVGSARRALLHQRVAVALEQEGEPAVEALAYHYARSARGDKAVRYLEQAGDRALAQRAHAAAERYYCELAQRLGELGQPREAARAHEKWGAVLRLAARYDAALAVFEQALAAYEAAGDREDVWRVVARIGHLYTDMGEPELGVRRLQPILHALEGSPPSHGLAALYGALAALCASAGCYGEELAAAERAVELARLVGNERIGVSAAFYRGFALLQIGRVAEARAALDQVIGRAEAQGDLEVLCWGLNVMTMIHVIAGELRAAVRSSARAFEVAQQRGDPAQIAFMTHNAHWPALLRGDWAEARQAFEQAVAMNRAIKGFYGSAYALLFLGWLACAEGRWDEAAEMLDESIALAAHNRDREALRWVQPVRAELDIVQGHPEQAVERLSGLLDEPGFEELGVTFLLPTLAWAQLEAGKVAAAQVTAAHAVRRGRAQGHRLALVAALRVQALLAIRQEQWDDAVAALEEGLTTARRMPYPYAEAHLLHVYGQLHAREGRIAPARERLMAARALFARLGAQKDAEQVQDALAIVPARRPCPESPMARSPVPPP